MTYQTIDGLYQFQTHVPLSNGREVHLRQVHCGQVHEGPETTEHADLSESPPSSCFFATC